MTVGLLRQATRRGAWLLVAAGLALAGAAAPARADYGVSDVRVGEHGTQTRFVIELNGTSAIPDYRVFTLADPYRVVIDLPRAAGAWPNEPGNATGLIASYRFGHFDQNVSRVVIDAASPVSVAKSFGIESSGAVGPRIVIDLKETDRASFIMAAGAPADAFAPDQPKSLAQVASARSVPSVTPTRSLREESVAKDPKRDGREVVVIDPGHGGTDPGAHGANGTQEKYVVLAFAKEFAKQLRATGRYDVYLTRDDDTFIPLRQRVAIAQKYGADLFVSIHADSISKKDVSGMSVYTLSETASDKEAAALARKENLSDVIAGVDVSNDNPEVSLYLIELAQRATKNESARFARSMISYASQQTSLLRRTHRFAGFAVLKAPDTPSVLVELGFLTNNQDEKNLNSSAWRKKVAGSFVRAVDGYFGSQYADGGL